MTTGILVIATQQVCTCVRAASPHAQLQETPVLNRGIRRPLHGTAFVTSARELLLICCLTSTWQHDHSGIAYCELLCRRRNRGLECARVQLPRSARYSCLGPEREDKRAHRLQIDKAGPCSHTYQLLAGKFRAGQSLGDADGRPGS